MEVIAQKRFMPRRSTNSPVAEAVTYMQTGKPLRIAREICNGMVFGPVNYSWNHRDNAKKCCSLGKQLFSVLVFRPPPF
jgi:hypothetical protein